MQDLSPIVVVEYYFVVRSPCLFRQAFGLVSNILLIVEAEEESTVWQEFLKYNAYEFPRKQLSWAAMNVCPTKSSHFCVAMSRFSGS